MTLLKSTTYIILSFVILAAAWAFFGWIIPFIMNLSWFWLFIIFSIGVGFLIPLIGILPGLLALLVSKLRSGNIVETILVVLIALYFLISSVATPWIQGASANFKWTVTALAHNFLVAGVYWGVTLSLLLKKDE